MYDDDAPIERLARIVKAARFAVEQNGTEGRRVYAGNYLYQCRFSRSVFAEQRVNFAFIKIDRNIGQGFNAGKFFRNVFYL